jgi:cytosine/uracil/thiamine/allantoin permease
VAPEEAAQAVGLSSWGLALTAVAAGATLLLAVVFVAAVQGNATLPFPVAPRAFAFPLAAAAVLLGVVALALVPRRRRARAERPES